MNIEIDGSTIKTEAEFHEAISAALNFPSYYGKNLDALDECLVRDTERPVILVWNHSEISEANLGSRFDKIVNVMEEVEAQDVDWGWKDRFQIQLN